MNTNKRYLSSSTDPSSTSSKRQKKLSRAEELEMKITEVEADARMFESEIRLALASDTSAPEFAAKLRLWVLEMTSARKNCAGREPALKPPPSQVGRYANAAQYLYELTKEYVQLKVAIAATLPDPSEYAMKDAWRDAQAKQSEILCLRPPERTGLPLSTLHDAFRQFERDAKMPFHLSAETTSAARAASLLVRTMGDAFDDEDARPRAIRRCLQPVFPRFWAMQIHAASDPEDHSAVIAASYSSVSSASETILLVDKDEAGIGGDPYMQIARAYHMYVKDLKDQRKDKILNALAHGAPTFLISVLGPLLSVAGGFYDGKAVIVEPLCNPLWMLTGAQRENALAQVLHALQRGVQNIEASLSQPAASFPPGVPRLYHVCHQLPVNGIEAPIHFLSVFRTSCDKPIFNAELRGFNGQVLAKMTSRSYGVSVHAFLADHGFAPRLLGVCELDNQCPAIYVMEKLDDSWVSLTAWSEEAPVNSEQRSAIRSQIYDWITEIIGLLQGENFVHGDLRTTNMMIKKDGSALKLVDFDWAGEAGQARYPVERNGDIKDWPIGTEPGGVISQGDDHALFENWWAGFLT